MAWFDVLPLNYSEPSTRNALQLLKRVYRDPDLLKEITRLAGLDEALINFHKAPALLPMEVMERAASQGRMTELLAEVLVDASSTGIHEDLWKLLGTDAPRVHAAALAIRADFNRLAALPSPATYAVNGSEGDLQRIVNVLAKFHDSALLQFELASREARMLRIELAGRGEGTGWLVGPEHVLTAYHVVSKMVDAWENVRARLDYKIVPKLGGQILERGRVVKLAGKPLLAHSNHGDKKIELSETGAEASLLDFALLRLDEPVGSQGLGPDGHGDEERGWYELPTGAHSFDPRGGTVRSRTSAAERRHRGRSAEVDARASGSGTVDGARLPGSVLGGHGRGKLGIA